MEPAAHEVMHKVTALSRDGQFRNVPLSIALSSCCFQPMESGKIVTTSRMPFITAMPHSELLWALGKDSSTWPLPLWFNLGSPVSTSYRWVLQCVPDISVIYSTFIYIMAHHRTHLSSMVTRVPGMESWKVESNQSSAVTPLLFQALSKRMRCQASARNQICLVPQANMEPALEVGISKGRP